MPKKNLGAAMAIVLMIVSVVAVLVCVYLYFFGVDFFSDRRIVGGDRVGGIAHFYNDPKTSIEKIAVKVFYVVPKNRENDVELSWSELIKSAFEKLVKFHEIQFRGLSDLRYDIFPKPVILENEDLFYGATSTDQGNPMGLVAIAEEIDRRVFRQGGDLYDPVFTKPNKEEYPIIGLIYEGVGASGGVIYETETDKTKEEIAAELGVPESMVYIVDVESASGFFLLNHEFLKKKELATFGPTFLYHELAHAFGLPDRDETGDIEQANDIMGLGRREPIDGMYIGSDILKNLGIIPK